MTLHASDVMIKDVITVSESTPLKDVTKMFSERKITGAPVVNAASVVTDSVSGDTSTMRLRSSFFTTVRQMPFTLTLSPIFKSPRMTEARIDSRVPVRVFSIDATAPISSTIPVNISLS